MLRTAARNHRILRTARTAATALTTTTATRPATAAAAMRSDVASASPFFGAVGSFSTMPMPPSFSAGTDKNAATEALRPLITPDAGGKWTLTADGYGVERSFKFATFNKTWVSTLSYEREPQLSYCNTPCLANLSHRSS